MNQQIKTLTALITFAVLNLSPHTALWGYSRFEEIQKLTASDAASDDQFGWTVAISGDTAVVGTPFDDDAGANSGSAYIFERNQGSADEWGQVTKLTALDEGGGHEFGLSVAISGDTVVVGARFDDENGYKSGAAYVFERNQDGVNNWGQVTKITATDAAIGDRFGSSVAISGAFVVVGSVFDDDGGNESGSAYIFERNQGGADNWGQVMKLTASDAAALDRFAGPVSISGDTVVVGSARDDDACPADPDCNSGSAYVFARNQGGADSWGQVMKLTASDAAIHDQFGLSVAISGDTVIVGAYADDDAEIINSGSAYIFERNQGGADNWGQLMKLTASDRAAVHFFGWSVSLNVDTAVVGAPDHEDPGGGDNSGAAYVFERNHGGADNWGQIMQLTASDAAAEDFFGFSVSISGDTVAVGANRDDDACPAAPDCKSGSAYIFGPLPPADLSITKTDSADPVVAGTQFDYTITVQNFGPADAQDVVVTDTLSPEVVLGSTSGCVEDPSGAPTCTLGTIASGDFGAYDITVTVDPATTGTITNQAVVTSNNPEALPGDESVTETTTVTCPDDVVLANEVITGVRRVEARVSVTLGPNFIVDGTAVEVVAGQRIAIGSGTYISGGFSASTDVDACQ